MKRQNYRKLTSSPFTLNRKQLTQPGTHIDEHDDEVDGDFASERDDTTLVVHIPNCPSTPSDDEPGDEVAHKRNISENQGAKIPVDVQAMRALLEKWVLRCCGTTVYIYDVEFGCFEEQTEASLYVAIRKCVPPDMDMKLGKHKMAEVVHRLVSRPELQVSYTEFDSHAHLINLRNAVFDVNQQRYYPHSSEFLFTSYIDADCGESNSGFRVYRSNRCGDEKGSYFKRFLEDCTGGDHLKMKSLQQLTGYIISNEWRAKKFFVLLGLPHTGKSVWLALWRSLIGSKHNGHVAKATE